MYLLDTNAIIAIFKDTPASVREHFHGTIDARETVATSAIVLFELWFGVARSGRWQENADRLRKFLSGGIEVIDFSTDDAQVAGELRNSLQSAGRQVGKYDLLIAAQAIRRSLVLVTANMREFERIDGLVCENWME